MYSGNTHPGNSVDQSTSCDISLEKAKPEAGKLTVSDGVKFLVGMVIGVGIFTSATFVHLSTNSFWLTIAVWTAGGAVCIFGGFSYVELVKRYPGSGGEHVYVQVLLGKFGMTIFDWTLFYICRPTCIAFFAIKFADSLLSISDTFRGSPAVTRALATGCAGCAFVVIIVFVTICFPRLSAKMQRGLTMFKFVALIAVVPLSIVCLIKEPSIFKNTYNAVAPAAGNKTQLGAAMIGALLAFDGWNAVCSVYDKFLNPGKVLPIVITGGCATIVVTYLLIVLCYFFVTRDFANAVSIFASISEVLFGDKKYGVWFGNPVICLAILSTTQSTIEASIETFQCAVDDGTLPASFGAISKRFGTCSNILLAQGVLSCTAITGALLWNIADGMESINISTYTANWSTTPLLVFYMVSALALFKRAGNLRQSVVYHFLFPLIFALAVGAVVVLTFLDDFGNWDHKATAFQNVLPFAGVLLFAGVYALLPKGAKRASRANKAPLLHN